MLQQGSNHLNILWGASKFTERFYKYVMVPLSQKQCEDRVFWGLYPFLMLSSARRMMMLNLFLTAFPLPEHWSFRV